MTERTVDQKTVLEIKGLTKHFYIKDALGRKKGTVRAVNDVSLQLYEKETYGLVGESGCGKSTLGRTTLRLIEPTDGQILFNNKDIITLSSNEQRTARKNLQMVFQDPYSSLNPRKRIGHTLEETLAIHKIGSKKERTTNALKILHEVGLQEDHYYRFPHEFSGGQRQRIGLARALIVNPKVIICDEPVSALDVSVQSQVINLLKKIQSDYNVTYLFISHDLSVVRHICDRIGVMYLGELVEEAPTDELFANPQHPYTQALLSAVPVPNPNLKKERIVLKGEIPTPLNLPSGCHFHTRCPYATDICKEKAPAKKEVGSRHFVSCHLVD